MPASFQSLQQGALHLSPDERLRLANALLASVESEDSESKDAAWDREIRRRITEFDSGNVETIPGKQVFEELDRRLQR